MKEVIAIVMTTVTFLMSIWWPLMVAEPSFTIAFAVSSRSNVTKQKFFGSSFLLLSIGRTTWGQGAGPLQGRMGGEG